jgi:hypothetical protein
MTASGEPAGGIVGGRFGGHGLGVAQDVKAFQCRQAT